MRSRAAHGLRGAQLWRQLVAFVVVVCALIHASIAKAEDKEPPKRAAQFEWTETRDELYVSISYRDVVDATLAKKLSRGLPTTIVLTGTLYQEGSDKPVSTTVQSCKITWHVWNEAYRIEIVRPEGSKTGWTTTLEGVLRRCAEARNLLVATKRQLKVGARVHLKGKVQVNPVSPEILSKIKQWVNRPVRTGTAAPGDALFSTFTGLFMQRIGEAERLIEFSTPPSTPVIREASKNEG